jgi:hypothetical protein
MNDDGRQRGSEHHRDLDAHPSPRRHRKQAAGVSAAGRPYSAPPAPGYMTAAKPRQRIGSHAPGLTGPTGAGRPKRALSAVASNVAHALIRSPLISTDIGRSPLFYRAIWQHAARPFSVCCKS